MKPKKVLLVTPKAKVTRQGKKADAFIASQPEAKAKAKAIADAQAAIEARNKATAKAKKQATKVVPKQTKADKAKADKAAAAELKKKQDTAKATQNAQSLALRPKENMGSLSTIDKLLMNYLRKIGVKSPTPAHIMPILTTSSSGIKLMPLSKCAHAIGLKLGFIPESDSTVTDETCKLAYPKHWDAIRDTYNETGDAFKARTADMMDTHRLSHQIRASKSKGGKSHSATVTIVAKARKGATLAEESALTGKLREHGMRVAVSRFNSVGSAALMNASDFGRWMKSTFKKTDKGPKMNADATRPAWMSAQQWADVIRRVEENVEKNEVILSYVRGCAEAKIKAMKGEQVATS